MAKTQTTSIKAVVEGIRRNKFLLPAIQREFVWTEEQITNFFDSLMRGYPFGTLLFWRIEPEHVGDYRFYAFMNDYHERDLRRCEFEKYPPPQGFTSVLDGQQRLTALNIGLEGTYCTRRKYGRKDDDSSYVMRRLYLNLLSEPDEEKNVDYEFAFKPDAGGMFFDTADGRLKWWLRVGGFFANKSCADSGDVMDFAFDNAERIAAAGLEPKAVRKKGAAVWGRLKSILERDDELPYFEETKQDLDHVLKIFIRLNMGGTKLSYSDLLLSIAVSQWKDHDAREVINKLADDLSRRHDFELDKDFILKAGLVLADIGNIQFHVKNFTAENMRKLEAHWDEIRRMLLLTAALFASFGYSSKNLGATAVLIPVAYYLQQLGVSDEYVTSTRFQADRAALRGWIGRTLLKPGIWSGQSDTFLARLREGIRLYGRERFPIEALERTVLRPMGRSTAFEEEDVEELLDLRFGMPRVFALLSLISPVCDINRAVVHVDHIYPRAMFDRIGDLRRCGMSDEEIKRAQWCRNSLPNLELLPGGANVSKNDQPPKSWLESRFPNPDERRDFMTSRLIGEVSDDPKSFLVFYEDRRERLRVRLIETLVRVPAASAAKIGNG